MRIVLIKDLHAAHLGLDPEMGLLHSVGAILDNCLPHIEEKLLKEGFALTEEEWLKRQAKAGAKSKEAPANKRGSGPRENK